MAICTIAAPLTGIRGTIGGIVYSANSSGPYCKAWAMPTHNPSIPQQIMAGIISQWKPLWDLLTPLERAAWVAFGLSPNELDFNSLGVQYFLGGYQWYVRSNTRRSVVGLAATATPPTGAAAPPVTGINITPTFHAGGTCDIDWTPGFFGATDSCICSIALGATSNQTYPANNWRIAYAQYNPGNGPADIYNSALGAFGMPALGWTIWARFWNQALLGNRSTSVTVAGTVT